MPSDSRAPDPQTDPYIYASILNGFITDRNPIQALVGDISARIQIMLNLPKNRKMAQLRIKQLEQQIAKVENNISLVHPQSTGTRLNKIR